MWLPEILSVNVSNVTGAENVELYWFMLHTTGESESEEA